MRFQTPTPLGPAAARPSAASIMCLCLGAGLMLWGFVDLVAVRRMAAWPTVQGKLDAWSIETHQSRGRRGRGGSTSYSVGALYHFTVDGKEYKGTRVHGTDDRSWFRSSAESEWLERQAGSACEVHYDPSDPSQSCLDPSAGSRTIWKFLVGLFFTAVGGIPFLRRGRPEASP